MAFTEGQSLPLQVRFICSLHNYKYIVIYTYIKEFDHVQGDWPFTHVA